MQRDGALTEGLLDAGNRHEAMRQVEQLSFDEAAGLSDAHPAALEGELEDKADRNPEAGPARPERD